MSLTTDMNRQAPVTAQKLDSIVLPKDYDPLKDQGAYMNPHMLAFFYRLLKEKVPAATQEIEHHSQILRQPINHADSADNAAVIHEQTVARKQIEKQRQLRNKITLIVQEMEINGTDSEYGYCEQTHLEIGIERLVHMPHATRTVEAQERQEAVQKQFRSRGGGLNLMR